MTFLRSPRKNGLNKKCAKFFVTTKHACSQETENKGHELTMRMISEDFFEILLRSNQMST